MFEIVISDLLAVNAAAICHQVNCQGVMGAGLAKSIAKKYPEVQAEYSRLCKEAKAFNRHKALLGTIQVVPVDHYTHAVVNMFGQEYYGHHGVYTDYEALARCFEEINRQLPSKRIAFPYGIGCGLAGGDWMTVEKLMITKLWNCDVVVCLKESD